MDSFFKKYSNGIILFALIAAQMLGLAVQVRRPNEDGSSSNLLHLWVVKLISPIEKGFVHSAGFSSGIVHNYFYLRSVRRENLDLKQQIENMRVQNVRLQQDAAQARRIQSLLGFKEQYIHKTVAAQVIGTSGSDKSCLIYIDRGADDGIRPDMAVITPDGIVGKVIRVQSSTAEVLEINDQTSGVGALLEKSRLQGIAKGTPGGDVMLNNIMSDEKVEPGDLITTSGGDRIFPKGLPIGVVASAYPGRDTFLNIRLKPSASLNRLEEVLVITEVQKKEPDTRDLGPIRASDILAARLPSVPQQPAPGTTAPPATTPGAANLPAGVAPKNSNPAPQQGSTKPNEAKPNETKPNETKPGETKPATPKSAAPKSTPTVGTPATGSAATSTNTNAAPAKPKAKPSTDNAAPKSEAPKSTTTAPQTTTPTPQDHRP